MNRPNSFIGNYQDALSAGSLRGKLIGKARNPFWLAPMAGITDICYRQLMDEMGAGVLVSELVSAKGLLYNSGKTHKMIETHRDAKSLVGVQLFGESEEDIINAAHYVKKCGSYVCGYQPRVSSKKSSEKRLWSGIDARPSLSRNVLN